MLSFIYVIRPSGLTGLVAGLCEAAVSDGMIQGSVVNRERLVPLSKRVLDVLAEAAELSNGSGLVFLARGSRSSATVTPRAMGRTTRRPPFTRHNHPDIVDLS